MSQDSTDILHAAAMRWYGDHLAEHLAHDRALAVMRCTAWLLEGQVTDASTARVTALRALGAVEARANGAHIDIDRTTSHAVFLIDPASGREFAFTAHDLVQLARRCTDSAPYMHARTAQVAA